MMQVLIYRSRITEGPVLWDVTGPKLGPAYLALFRYFRDDMKFYQDLTNPKDFDSAPAISALFNTMKQLFDKASVGDAVAAKQLLQLRRQHCFEYEQEWHLQDVREP